MKKILWPMIIVLLTSCAPAKEDTPAESLSDSTFAENINHDLIEPSMMGDDHFGDKSYRFKQNLQSEDFILDLLKNYYTKIKANGDIIINSSILYPYVPGSEIIEYKHISRRYLNNDVDVHEFVILLQNDTVIRARIFSPYLDQTNDAYGILFYAQKNWVWTTLDYEFGDALRALGNESVKSIVNKLNTNMITSTLQDEKAIHHYFKLPPLSSVDERAADIYEYFVFEIYYVNDSPEAREYVRVFMDGLRYYF